MGQPVGAGKRSKPPTYTIGFRLDGASLHLLEEEAQKYRMSLHAYARRLVLEGLEDTERERVREEVAATREEVARLREDMATVLEMILMNLTQVPDEEVRAWVSRHLRQRPGATAQ